MGGVCEHNHRAKERGDYERRPWPLDPAGPDDRIPLDGGRAGSPAALQRDADPDDFAWSLLAGAIRQLRRPDTRRAA